MWQVQDGIVYAAAGISQPASASENIKVMNSLQNCSCVFKRQFLLEHFRQGCVRGCGPDEYDMLLSSLQAQCPKYVCTQNASSTFQLAQHCSITPFYLHKKTGFHVTLVPLQIILALFAQVLTQPL